MATGQRGLARKPRVNLLGDQTTELTMVELGQLIDHLERQPQSFTDDARRSDRPALRADENAVNPATG